MRLEDAQLVALVDEQPGAALVACLQPQAVVLAAHRRAVAGQAQGEAFGAGQALDLAVGGETHQAALAQERPETLAGRFERIVEYLAATSGVDAERILAASMITTSGSLAQLPVAVADQALRSCAAVSRLVREKYGLPKE